MRLVEALVRRRAWAAIAALAIGACSKPRPAETAAPREEGRAGAKAEKKSAAKAAPKADAPPPPAAAAPPEPVAPPTAAAPAKPAAPPKPAAAAPPLSARAGGGAGRSVASAPAPERREWPSLQGIPVPTTRKFLGATPPSLATLGEVAKFVTSALEEHGYEEVGYFRYEDGFAIATRPERIAADAKPLREARWPQARVRAGTAQSLNDLFEVDGKQGDRYRSFVFVCVRSGSDVGLHGGAQQTWGLWKTGSANPEGDPLLAKPAAGHALYAFIYELSQDGGGKVLVATASANTAAEHLRAAGLARFMR